MDLLDAIRSIDKSHEDDVLNRLYTVWGEGLDKDNVLPEYPRPQMVRKSFINLNGYWDYAFTSSQSDIPLKMDGKILVPFSPESMLSGVERTLMPDELLWYKKILPPLDKPSGDSRLILHFGAVDQEATIYLNGQKIAYHSGGYLPFSVDITEYIYYEENELVVRVVDYTDSSHQSRGKQKLLRGGMYYTAQSGIWQTVWMEWVPCVYIKDLKISPSDNLEYLDLTVYVSKKGEPVTVTVLDDDSMINTQTRASDSDAINMKLTIADAILWSPEDPHLYDLVISCGDDKIHSYFAMRSFTIEKDDKGIPRFCLNHKPYFLNGILDQGYWPDGLYTAPADEAFIFDIEEMKRLGFNMLRKHAKIEAARWYYHCDRLGMIVWQDMVSGGTTYAKPVVSYLPTLFPKLFGKLHDGPGHYHIFSRDSVEGRMQWTEEMQDTIKTLINVPCIATWVLFNEGWGQFDANKATKLAREADPSRPIDQASGWHDQHGGDYLSHHNYFRKLKAERDQYDRAFVYSEYGGFAYHVDGHSSVDRVYGYKRYDTLEEFNTAYKDLMEKTFMPLEEKGLSGGVYTQVCDVEEEVNGLMTYDRKVCKIK
ncbi:MAG: glycoside hydrolase family 2 [Butyrivibrio sp.]|nr:glycoside hydrolase family 2 [Butyrivibrio sp.]